MEKTMKFFRTTISLVALSLIFESSFLLASDVEDSPTARHFTKVVGDNMDILSPMFEEMQNTAPEEMVVYGKLKNTNPFLCLESSTGKIGKVPVDESNREFFRTIPHTGAAVVLTDDNKSIYDQIVYDEDDVKINLGKTFGVVPKFKGETDNDLIRRIRSILDKLSYLNVE